MNRQVLLIIVGMMGAALLSWYLYSTAAIETLMADTTDEPTPLSTPLVIGAIWALLIYPVLFHRLKWLRDQVRIVLQLTVVVYVMLVLLVVIGVLGALQMAIEPKVDVAMLLLTILATVALLVGAVASYRELKQG